MNRRRVELAVAVIALPAAIGWYFSSVYVTEHKATTMFRARSHGKLDEITCKHVEQDGSIGDGKEDYDFQCGPPSPSTCTGFCGYTYLDVKWGHIKNTEAGGI